MSTSYHIESDTLQVIDVEITTPSDPTGAVPSFSFTARDATDAGSFNDGTWSGSYDATTDRVIASTPSCGSASATVDLTSATYWKLWAKWVVGSETVVKTVGIVRVG